MSPCLMILVLLMVNSLSMLRYTMGSPSGAPPQSCATMEPQHFSSASNEPCPFETVLDRMEMYSNESLTLTLRLVEPTVSTDWDGFAGFLAMGFDQETNQVLGTFEKASAPEDNFQIIDCLDQYDIAATHINSNSKNSVHLIWRPPINFDGTIIFYTTFAASMHPYWVKERAKQVVRISRSSVDQVSESTASPSDPSTHALNYPDVYDGCPTNGSSEDGVSIVTKGCFGIPGSCIESRDCTMMTTYKLIDDNTFEFEIYGRAASSSNNRDSYVAVGFSEDSKMGEDSVIQCVNYRGKMAVYNSYNDKQANYRITNNNKLNREFVLMEAAIFNGNLYCRVRQPAYYSLTEIGRDFHLNNQSYYLLMAVGPTGSGQILKHDHNKFSSSKAIDLTKVDSAGKANKSSVLKKLHGSFMIIAWLIAASIGVLMPAYMKKSFNGRQLMGKDLWFIIHQGLMTTTWLLTMAGFVIIFIDVDGWAGNRAHPIIGCITTSLAFIQPFMAALRPLPSSTNRYIFNWSHLLVGYTSHILAVICIFLAVDEAQLPEDAYWFLTTHIVCYVAAQIALTVLATKNDGTIDKDVQSSTSVSSMNRSVVSTFGLIAVGLSIIVIILIAQL